MNTGFHSIIWLPLLSPSLLAVMAGLCVLVGGYGILRHVKGLVWRMMAGLIMVLWLAHPQLLRPTWQTQPQDMLILLDHSPSTALDKRQILIDRQADRLEEEARHLHNVHVHRVSISGGNGQGTRLFEALAGIIPDYAHLSSVFLLTDGMVHDAPDTIPKTLFFKQTGQNGKTGRPIPLHVLLGAAHEEIDRHLRILSAPPYVIVGQKAHIRVEVDDTGLPEGQEVDIMERQADGSSVLVANTVSGQPVELDIKVTHPGLSLRELYASPLPGEVSLQNNSAVLRLHGVRDRLKVLLVSGVPNQAARVWRQLLKADPSVDLVHFTILRSPETSDDTPLSDLALIPFPTHELFEQKIRSFDLIILDGFRNQNILPQSYLRNIADYVRKGGGLLVVSGPEMAQDGSLQDTPLGSILPAHIPANGVIEQKFVPRLTALGLRHPVTANLPDSASSPSTEDEPANTKAQITGSQVTGSRKKHGWGPWYRRLRPDHVQGKTLLGTADGSPLLLLNHIEDHPGGDGQTGQGRVAMLLSDQIWLWSRGGGVTGETDSNTGPQAELLRRLAHWLMKEPDLEENRLEARINGHELIIERYSATAEKARTANIMSPSRQMRSLILSPAGQPGVLHGVLPLSDNDEKESGIWTIRQDGLTAFASPPETDPIEDRDLRSTASILAPLAHQSGGGIFWLGKNPAISLRQVSMHQASSGVDWAGLPLQQAPVPGKDHFITMFPDWLALVCILLLLALGWKQEGYQAKKRNV